MQQFNFQVTDQHDGKPRVQMLDVMAHDLKDAVRVVMHVAEPDPRYFVAVNLTTGGKS